MDALVNIDVDDLDRAVEFYCTALELRVSRHLGGGVVELLGGNAPIYLLDKRAGSLAAAGQPRDYARHWTPVHLDFVVTDIDAAVARAIAAGAVLEQPVQTDVWGKLAVMADPFGHGFCFVQFLDRGYDEIATAPA
ncbi:MAG: VOC family protein [Rudaea sp.]|uniref:VOC family protein n=1 Tax=unclassified Rudaea TaxID=2627037 RepID=UPI0010F76C87|nr:MULTISPECIES: VOC family protein [unclassified Rudaea]MBN8884314.1 VOC family protein [Rudaea sp.]MBR0347175.1 VOC family protein [Rudaea sp.]